MITLQQTLETDYLVVGAGAMGMAFADTLLAESNASIVIVDRHDRPGGHWNDAYPFVRLHSASAYYGVGSTALGNDSLEATGANQGFYEQASAAEVCAYYDRIMRNTFLPTHRVRYFPMCTYQGDGRFTSLVSGAEHRVVVRKKIVDATFTATETPSTRPPKYAIAPGIQCIPPNALPWTQRAEHYVVIGAGKTGIDVCLWLLERGVSPERIVWIVPRDSWLIDRAHVQPRANFFAQRMGALATQMEIISQAQSIEHLFGLLDMNGQLLRIDPRVRPTRFRCATVSKPELEALRRLNQVVRLGHVRRIDSDCIVLDRGYIGTDYATLHIDCTASGIRSREGVPVFEGKTITLQPIRTCQQGFSAALIAHLEVAYQDDAEKNRFSQPVPLPIVDVDWLKMMRVSLANQQLWSSTPELRAWIANSRLDQNFGRAERLSEEDSALVQRFKHAAARAPEKLGALLAAD